MTHHMWAREKTPMPRERVRNREGRGHILHALPEFLSHEMSSAIHLASGHILNVQMPFLWPRTVPRHGPGNACRRSLVVCDAVTTPALVLLGKITAVMVAVVASL